MTQLLEWLTPIRNEFPVVALVLGALWLVVRWLDRRHNAEVERLKGDAATAWERATAEVSRVREDHAVERTRMTEWYESHIRQLRTRLRELERRAEGGEP